MNPALLHTQYLTDDKGKRVAVQLPIDEFEALVSELLLQQQKGHLAAQLAESLGEVADMRAGRTPKRPAKDLLNAL